MKPGETMFGGRGILIPFNPSANPSSGTSTPQSASAQASTELSNSDDPMQPEIDRLEVALREEEESRKTARDMDDPSNQTPSPSEDSVTPTLRD
jgi:hypothetical protein